MLTLGQRLRVAMEWANLEPIDMAGALGRGETTIRNYVAERKPISRGNLVAWAVACGVDVTWLETGEAGPTNGPGLTSVAGTGFEPVTSGLLERSNVVAMRWAA